MGKIAGLSIYGTAKRKITQKRRLWYPKRKQHYWKKVTQKVGKKLTKRYTFYGTVEQIRDARDLMIKEGLVPKKKYQDQIEAQRFVDDTGYRYRASDEGEWIDFEEVETP